MTLRTLASFCFCCVGCLVSNVASARDWDWSVTPYVWGIGTELNTAVDIPESGRQPFDDLIDRLDFAAQIHFEGHTHGWGFLLDLTNLQLSDRELRESFEIDTDSSITLLEGAVLFGLPGEGLRTELMLGFRTLLVDIDLEIEDTAGAAAPLQPSSDGWLLDAMFGVRFQYDLGERWQLMLRTDVAAGDTEFSWNASALAGRKFGDRGMLVVGYRHLGVELKTEGGLLEPELTVSGPEIGYTFTF